MERRSSAVWEQIAPAFEVDGSLRDLYIQGTTLREWKLVWSLLRNHVPPPAYLVNGVAEPMPAEMGDILDADGAPHLVSLQLGPLQINCHFFSSTEIEFDIDPREVGCPEDADQLLEFMASLSRTTGKDVLLTEESHPQYELLRVRPDGQVEPHPSLIS